MMVLLGEVGGVDEYDVCKALQDGRITKPLVAWCIGTCAKVTSITHTSARFPPLASPLPPPTADVPL